MTTAKTIGYWVTTGLTAAAFIAGGAMDLMRGPEVSAVMGHLGYPLYFATILGVWKLLGAAALLAPGIPRLKEWAYAGILFDLTGAAASHAAVGDGAQSVATPLALLAIAGASWALRPQSRTLVPVGTATHAPVVRSPVLRTEPAVASAT